MRTPPKNRQRTPPPAAGGRALGRQGRIKAPIDPDPPPRSQTSLGGARNPGGKRAWAQKNRDGPPTPHDTRPSTSGLFRKDPKKAGHIQGQRARTHFIWREKTSERLRSTVGMQCRDTPFPIGLPRHSMKTETIGGKRGPQSAPSAPRMLLARAEAASRATAHSGSPPFRGRMPRKPRTSAPHSAYLSPVT